MSRNVKEQDMQVANHLQNLPILGDPLRPTKLSKVVKSGADRKPNWYALSNPLTTSSRNSTSLLPCFIGMFFAKYYIVILNKFLYLVFYGKF